jgi:hypothetical protein
MAAFAMSAKGSKGKRKGRGKMGAHDKARVAEANREMRTRALTGLGAILGHPDPDIRHDRDASSVFIATPDGASVKVVLYGPAVAGRLDARGVPVGVIGMMFGCLAGEGRKS